MIAAVGMRVDKLAEPAGNRASTTLIREEKIKRVRAKSGAHFVRRFIKS